uniref:Uncharacterized protein n=1 Tax=Populus trichocarpa TaxID=3694 RepID=A0A3N7GWG5_POPTR
MVLIMFNERRCSRWLGRHALGFQGLYATALENDCRLHVGLFVILSFIVEYVGLYIMQCLNVSTSPLFLVYCKALTVI